MRKRFINHEASIKTRPRSQRASLGVSRMGLGPHLFPGSCSSKHTTPELPRGSCSWLIPPRIQPPPVAHPAFLPTPTWPTHPLCLQSQGSPHSPSAQGSFCGFNQYIARHCDTLISPVRCMYLRGSQRNGSTDVIPKGAQLHLLSLQTVK